MEFIGEEKIKKTWQNANDAAGSNTHGLVGKDRVEIMRQVFFQPGDVVKSNVKSQMRDLTWYADRIKKPVIILSLLEIAAFLAGIVPQWRVFILGFVDPMMFIVFIFMAGGLTVKSKTMFGDNVREVIASTFLFGFFIGLVQAIIKLLWVGGYAAMMNLLIEPVFNGGLAVVIGAVIMLFMMIMRFARNREK